MFIAAEGLDRLFPEDGAGVRVDAAQRGPGLHDELRDAPRSRAATGEENAPSSSGSSPQHGPQGLAGGGVELAEPRDGVGEHGPPRTPAGWRRVRTSPGRGRPARRSRLATSPRRSRRRGATSTSRIPATYNTPPARGGGAANPIAVGLGEERHGQAALPLRLPDHLAGGRVEGLGGLERRVDGLGGVDAGPVGHGAGITRAERDPPGLGEGRLFRGEVGRAAAVRPSRFGPRHWSPGRAGGGAGSRPGGEGGEQQRGG